MALWAGDNASGKVSVTLVPKWPSGSGKLLVLRVEGGGSLIFTDRDEVNRVAHEMTGISIEMSDTEGET
jgi:hypothetical protein